MIEEIEILNKPVALSERIHEKLSYLKLKRKDRNFNDTVGFLILNVEDIKKVINTILICTRCDHFGDFNDGGDDREPCIHCFANANSEGALSLKFEPKKEAPGDD